MLITGGDLTVNGVRNFSNNKVNVFNPGNNTLTASGTMNFPRWYPSITTLRNGDKLVLGGRPSPSDVGNLGEPTPEVFNPAIWLENAARNCNYRADTRSTGMVLSKRVRRFRWRGDIFFENSGANIQAHHRRPGTMQDTGSLMAPGVAYLSIRDVRPFQVLTVRAGQRAQVVDLSTSPPVVTDVAQFEL